MAPDTTQKIVLTALGGSVATPPDGLTAEVIVVDSFADLKALPPDAVKGKILLFNEHFDKRLAAQGQGFEAYGQAVAYRAVRSDPRRSPRSRRRPCPVRRRSRLPYPPHRHDDVRPAAAEDPRRCRHRRRRRPARAPYQPGSCADEANPHPADSAPRRQLQRHRRLERHRASRAGRHRLRTPRLMGPRHWSH
jgi:hypothetical protein